MYLEIVNNTNDKPVLSLSTVLNNDKKHHILDIYTFLLIIYNVIFT